MSICPHCGASASAEKSAPFRFRCGVCGGPIVPAFDQHMRTDAELGSLVAAQRAHAMALGWTAAAVVLGAIAAMSAGLGVLLACGRAEVAATVLGALSLVAASLAAVGVLAARARRTDVRRKIDDAWECAAEEVLRAGGVNLSAPELAAAMRTDEAHAASLLGSLSAVGRARTHVRDDAELTYDVDARGEPEPAISPDDAGRVPGHGR